MSGYRGHISGAVIFFAIYMVGLIFLLSSGGASSQALLPNSVFTVVALCIICVLFGLWPDVDINSKGQDIFYALFFVLDVALIYYGRFHEAAYLGLFCILPVLGKHRGWTHTYWAMIIIPSPILLLPYVYTPLNPWAGLPYYGAAVVGYFSHLFMDGLVADIQPKRKAKLKRR